MHTFLSVFLLMMPGMLLNVDLHSSEQVKTYTFQLEFQHTFADAPFQLRKKYRTAFGDTIDFQRFQYYVSNIQLKSTSGKVWNAKNSYHLLNLAKSERSMLGISLERVPFKEVAEVSFGIGVDKTRNHGGVQDGDLDPLKGMFWTWSQGYIFLKSESYHYQQFPKRKGLIFHIGGDECYREARFSLHPKDVIKEKNQYHLPILVEIDKLFGGFEGASIELRVPGDGSAINVMGGPKSARIADNYIKMFRIGS